MAALTPWVDGLKARIAQIRESRQAHIPSNRYVSATVLLEQLLEPFRALSHKHRFARAVTGSAAGVDVEQLRDSLVRLLRGDFQAFVHGHLGTDTTGLADQVRTLKAAMESQVKVLNAHVESFHKSTTARLQNVEVQVNLFAALGIANHRDDIGKLNLRFTVLMRRFGDKSWTPSTGADWQVLQSDIAGLEKHVTFDRRLGLSDDALQFVRRILAGGQQAPTLLSLTPSVLAEIQKLREFAATVLIMRPE